MLLSSPPQQGGRGHGIDDGRARQRDEHGDGEHGSVREVSRRPGRRDEVMGESRGVRSPASRGRGARQATTTAAPAWGARRRAGSVLLQRSTKVLQNAP